MLHIAMASVPAGLLAKLIDPRAVTGVTFTAAASVAMAVALLVGVVAWLGGLLGFAPWVVLALYYLLLIGAPLLIYLAGKQVMRTNGSDALRMEYVWGFAVSVPISHVLSAVTFGWFGGVL